MSRFGSLGTRYTDDFGNLLINGFIKFTESGDANTDKDTFSDISEKVEFINKNPVPLSASGKQPNIFFSGTVRATLFTADGIQVDLKDPLGGDTSLGSFSDWNSLTIYSIPNIVVGSNKRFYISITDVNQGNNPTTDLVNWSELKFIHVWNPNETYIVNALVQASDGLTYVSLINNNLNNDPINSSDWSLSSLSIDDLTQAVVSSYAFDNF